MKPEHKLIDDLNARAVCTGTKTDDYGWRHRVWEVNLNRGLMWEYRAWDVMIGDEFRPKKQVTIEYKTGIGAEYKLEGVLHALLMDASAGELSFPDFCREYGYDADSRRAFSTWEACKENAKKLLRLYTPEEIETLREVFSDY